MTMARSIDLWVADDPTGAGRATIRRSSGARRRTTPNGENINARRSDVYPPCAPNFEAYVVPARANTGSRKGRESYDIQREINMI